MNINPTIYNAYKANPLPKTQSDPHRQLANGERPEAAEKTDRLSLSQIGATQRDAGKVVRSIMQDIRAFDEQEAPALVNQLRTGAGLAAYQVSSQDLADAILGRV